MYFTVLFILKYVSSVKYNRKRRTKRDRSFRSLSGLSGILQGLLDGKIRKAYEGELKYEFTLRWSILRRSYTDRVLLNDVASASMRNEKIGVIGINGMGKIYAFKSGSRDRTIR